MATPRLNHRLLLLALVGWLPSACNGAPVAPPTTTASSPTATPVPGATPSAQATASPTAQPSAQPPAETTLLRGRVYDADGKVVPDGTSVTLRSLRMEAPFEATATTAGGLYTVNGVPVDTQMAIVAHRDGWTSRQRVEVLVRNERQLATKNVVNFGGPADAGDAVGPAHFLSDHPEIARVEPVDDATSLSSERMAVKLVLSEALDAVNQRRLASSFLIIPNNDAALSDGTALPTETATDSELTGLHGGSAPATTSAYRYRQNAGFLNGFVTSDFKWEADGKTATFTLDAPVKTGKTLEGRYAVVLVQQDAQPIVDGTGLALGMDRNARFGNTVQGDVLRNVFKETDVSLASSQMTNKEARWADTHKSYTTFSVAKDTTPPRLVSVTARRNYADTAGAAADRLELTFSEPMIAYPQARGSELLSLNNYVVAAAETLAQVEARALKDNGTAANVNAGAATSVVRDALKGNAGMVINHNSASMPGDGTVFTIQLSVKDPRVVILNLPAGALPLEANYVKVLVGTDSGLATGVGKPVTDPAGNVVEANIQAGQIQ